LEDFIWEIKSSVSERSRVGVVDERGEIVSVEIGVVGETGWFSGVDVNGVEVEAVIIR